MTTVNIESERVAYTTFVANFDQINLEFLLQTNPISLTNLRHSCMAIHFKCTSIADNSWEIKGWWIPTSTYYAYYYPEREIWVACGKLIALDFNRFTAILQRLLICTTLLHCSVQKLENPAKTVCSFAWSTILTFLKTWGSEKLIPAPNGLGMNRPTGGALHVPRNWSRPLLWAVGEVLERN